MIEHTYNICVGKCEDDFGRVCYICSGLSWCATCGAVEGELLSYCPGFKLNRDTLEACYKGNIIDFIIMKQNKEAGYNIIKKIWE